MELKGKIVSGCQIATQTIRQQSPYFEEKGIEKKFLTNGSINVDIFPIEWQIVNPDFKFKDIVWRPDFSEDFNFIKLKFKFENKIYSGLLYNPKRTKNPKTIMEILSKHVKGIEYGKEIKLLIPKNKIDFLKPIKPKYL